jgi:hypothetical protein
LQNQEITVSVRGSVEKGTNTSESDNYVFIDTHGLRVSRQEKERVVEVLRTADGFHQSHVKLKKLASGCDVFNMQVDLGFSDTEEYGQLPGNFVQWFESDKAVQNAARTLACSRSPFRDSSVLKIKAQPEALSLLSLSLSLLFFRSPAAVSQSSPREREGEREGERKRER